MLWSKNRLADTLATGRMRLVQNKRTYVTQLPSTLERFGDSFEWGLLISSEPIFSPYFEQSKFLIMWEDLIHSLFPTKKDAPCYRGALYTKYRNHENFPIYRSFTPCNSRTRSIQEKALSKDSHGRKATNTVHMQLIYSLMIQNLPEQRDFRIEIQFEDRIMQKFFGTHFAMKNLCMPYPL